MQRRRFLRTIVLAPGLLVAGVAVLLEACGSDAEDLYGMVASCNGEAASNVSVSNTHTHSVCIPQAILDSPQDYTATLAADGTGHTHTVFLSMAQISTIAGGGAVGPLASSSNGAGPHAHDVSFT